MGVLRRMADKCVKCPKKEKCDHKKMELCAYIEKPTMAASAAQTATAELTEPLLVKHDYRDIKISESMTITIDVEEMKKQLERDFYKSVGLNYGA